MVHVIPLPSGSEISSSVFSEKKKKTMKKNVNTVVCCSRDCSDFTEISVFIKVRPNREQLN